MQAMLALARALALLGRPHEAVAKAHEVLQMARVPQTVPARQSIADFTLMAAAWHLALTYGSIDENDLAEESFHYAAANAERAGMPYQQAAIGSDLARLLHRIGRDDEAVAALESARAQFAAIDARARVVEAAELLARWRGTN